MIPVFAVHRDMLFKTRFGSIAKSLLAVKGKYAKNRFFV